jgi:ABC-2 type transport system ATP-binding protein
MSATLLELDRVRVRYGSFLAVDDVTFTLNGGDLLGMIGPNGAGKTTTLRAAAGLQPITTGSVKIMGEPIHPERADSRAPLGFTPDTPAVYDALTVAQYLQFIGDCYSMDRPLIRERIDFWLDQLWLRDKRDAPVKSLSRGMRQRLAVARTLMPDPFVVLLDEPAAGLDPGGRLQFRQLLASLRDQGKAIIVSSHILADLAEYCTHILIMERGRVLRFGTVADISGESAAADTTQYAVTLAARLGDVENRLKAFAKIRAVRVDGDKLTIELPRDKAAAAEALKDLIMAGLPVAEFRPIQVDLEQAYLRSGIAQVD